MGNANTSGRENRDLNLGENDLSAETTGIEPRLIAGMSGANRPQLTFHSVCGENVSILKQGRVAKRHESFCKGLAFSARPIDIDEIVVMKLAETASNWSGVLRFGVTNTNPQSLLGNLPKYACPDLTNKEGNWAKALTERYCQQGNFVHFYVSSAGEMHYGVNGVSKGLFFNGVNVTQPMWVLLDIYGNSTCVEFIDPSDVPALRNARLEHHRASTSASTSSSQPSTSQQHSGGCKPPSDPSSTGTIQRPPQPMSVVNAQSAHNNRLNDNAQALATAQIALELNQRLTSNVGGAAVYPSAIASFSPKTSYQPLKYNTGSELSLLEFHQICGRNVLLSPERTVATRIDHGHNTCGYVFTKRPVKLNEKVIIQILKIEPQSSGSLGFGITSCDPLLLNPAALPDDSDLLVDRKEYWAVQKDVAGTTIMEMDEFTFYVNEKGEIHFQRNNFNPRLLMHVDHTQSLYFFFDVLGITFQIRLVGTCEVSRHARYTGAATLSTVASNPSINSDRQQRRPEPVSTTLTTRLPHTAPHSSAPASPGVHQVYRPSSSGASQQLHVNLPPPQPNIPRNQNRTVSANSLPALNQAITIAPTPSNNQIGTNPFRHRAPYPSSAAPAAPQPPPRPPPPQWTTSASASQISTGSNPLLSNVTPQRQMDYVTASLGQLNVGGTTSARGDDDDGGTEECVVCMQSRIDCVLYTCGHMCMCHTCAMETWQRHSFCPVCRQPIKDVIKIFKSS